MLLTFGFANAQSKSYSTSEYIIILPKIKTIGLVKKELNLTNQYDQTNKKKIYA